MANLDNREIMNELKSLQAQVLQFRDMLGDEGRHVADEARSRGAAAIEAASSKARGAARYARDEASSVASLAREHPTATSGALLAIGLIGGVVGYLLGQSHSNERDNRWRWH